jgi:hypothetical protein
MFGGYSGTIAQQSSQCIANKGVKIFQEMIIPFHEVMEWNKMQVESRLD